MQENKVIDLKEYIAKPTRVDHSVVKSVPIRTEKGGGGGLSKCTEAYDREEGSKNRIFMRA